MDDDPEFFGLWENIWRSGPVRTQVDMNEQLDLAAPETYLQRSGGSILLHTRAIGIGAR